MLILNTVLKMYLDTNTIVKVSRCIDTGCRVKYALSVKLQIGPILYTMPLYYLVSVLPFANKDTQSCKCTKQWCNF